MATLLIGTTLLVLMFALHLFALGYAPELLEAAQNDFFLIYVIVFIVSLVLLIIGIVSVGRQIKAKEDVLAGAGVTVDPTKGVTYDQALDARDGSIDLRMRNTTAAHPVEGATSVEITETTRRVDDAGSSAIDTPASND